MTEVLSVGLYGKIVGYLTQTTKGQITFRFTAAYLSGPNRPVLSQSFEDNLSRTYSGQKHSLPPFFANLIPEPGTLRELIEKNLGVEPGDDLALLETVGRDLPGAVEVIRVDEEIFPSQDDQKMSAYMTEKSEDRLEAKTTGLRFSLAGVQMKFSVLRDPEKIALPAHNQDGDWIVKLGSARFPLVVQNEYAIMQWAKAAEFDVPECYIQDAKTVDFALKKQADFGDSVFVIRRYDRKLGKRIHQEDFAQITSKKPSLKYDHLKYEQCAGLVKQLSGDDTYYEFIRRLTFMIASGNGDAHLKNWSCLYLDSRYPSLAPMYDQVCTIAWPELDSTLALELAGTKNFFALDIQRFEELAKRAGADPNKTAETVQETLSQLVETWNKSQVSNLLPSHHAQRLQDFWERVPLLRSFASNMERPG
ncbi:MAG: HipA domain-containing protein [Phormidesmis sp.]